MKKAILFGILLLGVYLRGISQCATYYTYSNEGYAYFFADSSTGEDSTTTFSWTFGNGDTSSAQYPVETFAPGTYVVCLAIRTVDNGCNSDICDTITVAHLSCTAAFTYTHTGYNYQFTQQSTGTDASTTYYWDFGDEDQSSALNPDETYGMPGVYTVCLTVFTASNSCSNTYCLDVTVSPLNCQASFGYNTIGNAYYFADNSYGEDSTTSFFWDFGDGDTASIQNPIDSFPGPGTYLVCFTMNTVDSGCTNEFCEYISIPGCTALVNFHAASTDSFHYIFSDTSMGLSNHTIFSWSVYDSSNQLIDTASGSSFHYSNFPYTGLYNVCESVSDDTCQYDVCQYIPVIVPCQASFSYTHTGDTIQFTNTSSGLDSSALFAWNFGNGDTSAAKNPAYTFPASGGIYNVCLVINVTDVGCVRTACNVDTIINGVININEYKNGISLFPNPAGDQVIIDMGHLTVNEIGVFNTVGMEIAQLFPEKSSLIKVDISRLPSGIYLVQIHTGSNFFIDKLVISK